MRWQHHYREYEVVAFHFLPRLQKLQYLSFVTTPKWWVCSILQPFYMLQNYLGWLNCQQRTAATLGQVWILWEPSDDPGPGTCNYKYTELNIRNIAKYWQRSFASSTKMGCYFSVIYFWLSFEETG